MYGRRRGSGSEREGVEDYETRVGRGRRRGGGRAVPSAAPTRLERDCTSGSPSVPGRPTTSVCAYSGSVSKGSVKD